jgi:poly [ADP-ribose] polymerase 2/3/4
MTKKAIPIENAPAFDNYIVKLRCSLQKTDLKKNNNKFYFLELQKSGDEYRVFTHYGRTDSLADDPNSGRRQVRLCDGKTDAEKEFQRLKKSKIKGGYIEVDLVTDIDPEDEITSKKKTSKKKTSKKKTSKKKTSMSTTLPKKLEQFINKIYDEASVNLKSTVNISFTEKGMQTPLGILTSSQIEKGQVILDECFEVFKKYEKANSKKKKKLLQELTDLSSDFFSNIPHKIGRAKKAVKVAILDTIEEFREKQETLQLMRDMIDIYAKGSTFYEPSIDEQYAALNTKIEPVRSSSTEFKKIKKSIEASQVKTDALIVKRIWRIMRGKEKKSFKDVGNVQQLIHGTAPQNLVGILSRGLLMPKIVVKMGGSRTDEGWLGNGIYFANALCTTLYYSIPDTEGIRYAFLANVSLGKAKQFQKITYGITKPPTGYHSCHGISEIHNDNSEFEDDEFVIYNSKQQYLTHIIEYIE